MNVYSIYSLFIVVVGGAPPLTAIQSVGCLMLLKEGK